MKAFSWLFKSRKGENGDSGAAPAAEDAMNWGPVVEVPEWGQDVPAQPRFQPPAVEEYGRTEAVYEVPAWEPDVPAMEAPPQIQPEFAPDYDRFHLVEELPAWEADEPAAEIPPQPAAAPVDDYEPTRAVFDIPEWEPEGAVIEVQDQIPSWQEADYEKTQAVFEVPDWEPEAPAVPVQPEKAAPADGDVTVFSRTPAVAAAVPGFEDEKTQAARDVEAWSQPQAAAEPVDVRDMTGWGMGKAPQPDEGRAAPEAPKSEPVKPAAPGAVIVPEREAPKAASAPRKAGGIPVKPKVATPTAVDMKTPEVPDFGRSISAETCDFSLRQQWNWLGKLHEVIPTLRMGTEPSCVDYPLTLRNMEAAGDMRITVKRVAMGVGTLLSITNLENAVTCEDISKLREASQILTAYGKMVSGRQADAIRMTIRFLGVRVAELQMR